MYNLYAVWALPNGTFKVAKQLATTGANQFQFLQWPVSEYIAGLVGSSESAIVTSILTDDDLSSLPSGSALYTGYGISVEEMVAAKRYSLRYILG